MGILDIIAIPFGYVMQFCYFISRNYMVALLLFALIVKIVLFPLGIKQQKNQVKQAKLRPMENAIRKKYAGRNDKPTQMKMNEEIQKLYSEQNFNPMSGCLPLLLQFPIILALYNVVVNPLRYMCHLSVEKITELATKANDLGLAEFNLEKFGSYDGIALSNIMRNNFDKFSGMVELSERDIPNFNLFGNFLDLSQVPSFDVFKEGFSAAWFLFLIPILTFVVQFASSKILKKLSYTQAMQEGQGGCVMDFAMPLMSVYFCFIVPAAIAVYWMFQCILGVVQQYVLVKMYPAPTFTEEEMKEAERKVNSIQKKKNKPKSLYNEDDEDYSEYAKQLAARYAEEDAELEKKMAEAAENEAAEENNAPKLKEDDRTDTKFKKKK